MICLKSVVLFAILAVGNGQNDAPRRSRLVQEWVAGYEPDSSVADYNVMDLDQLAMEVELGKGTEDAFLTAEAIYELGGNSMSVAELVIHDGLPIDVFEGMPVDGWNANGDAVVGIVYEDAPQGSKSLRVQYLPSDIEQNHLSCKVGALVDEITDGCFHEGNNTLSILDNQIGYEYYLFDGTFNAGTLEQLTLGGSISDDDEGYFFDDFADFVNYYGETDYAYRIIEAAFNAGVADLRSGKSFNFEEYPLEASAQVIKKSTVNMGFATNVIDALEISVASCENAGAFDGDPIESLDRAVSYYTGSLEGRHGLGDGYLLYSQADQHCVRFRTCGETADSVSGTSMVNLEIFQLFHLMKENMYKNECDAARLNKKKIVQKMFVPMIQGALMSAYIQQDDMDTDEYEQSEGVAFAAAVLPVVARCSESDADVIYDNLGTQSDFNSDFQAVKSAFERNYACMGITCDDVGGLYSKGLDQFYDGAHPCNSTGENVAVVVGLLFAGIVLLCVLVGILIKRRNRKNGSSDDIVFKHNDTDGPPMA